MTNPYTQFLHSAADRLRELAEHAPDISPELHRFADDLDRLAAELSTDDASPEAA
jgi:hypothetical protein